jgi:hypothetical protein
MFYDEMTDNELSAHALRCLANHIETGNINLSANDCLQQGLKVKNLDDYQKSLIKRMRDLAKTLEGL